MTEQQLSTELNYIAEHGLETPVSFFSEANMLEAYNLIRQELDDRHAIYYAVKSCYHPPLLRAISRSGVGAEVLSELELDLALQNGFTKFIVNGMGRSYEFLKKASLMPNSCVIVDSLQDIASLDAISRENDAHINVGVRLDIKLPAFKGVYHAQQHKLGNDFSSTFFASFLKFCASNQRIKWDVLHVHNTINETNSSIYEATIKALRGHVEALKRNGQVLPERIDIGGGFEVFDPNQVDIFQTLFSSINEQLEEYFPDISCLLEPGRYLSAYSGYSIGRIVDIKSTANKQWLITDIGTNTLIPIPNARYKLVIPATTPKGIAIGVADGITSPGNVIVEDAYLEELPQIGDTICIANTGAYTDVYSTFWAYAPHRVCFKDKTGRITTFRSSEDIAALQQIMFKSGQTPEA